MRQPYDDIIRSCEARFNALGLRLVSMGDDSAAFSDGRHSIEFECERYNPLSMLITIVDSDGSRRPIAFLEDALDPTIRSRLNALETEWGSKEKNIRSPLVDPGVSEYIDLTVRSALEFVERHFHEIFEMSPATRLAYESKSNEVLRRLGITESV